MVGEACVALPAAWPQLTPDDLRRFRGLTYAELAVEVMLPFLGGTIANWSFICFSAFAVFGGLMTWRQLKAA